MTPPEVPAPAPNASATASPFSTDRLFDVALDGRAARLVLIEASATAFEAEFRHLAGRIAAETLARAAAGLVLIGSDLKGEERLALQVRAEGPLKGLLAETDARLRFRGYTQAKVLPALDAGTGSFMQGLGAVGRLQLIRSTGEVVVYRGVTALRKGDVAADLEAALIESSQIPSRLWLDHGYGRQLTHATGALLQALPGGDPADFAALAEQIATRAEAARPFPRDPLRLLAALLPPDVPRRILSERPVAFACRCSREKVVAMLRSLGRSAEDAAAPEQDRVTCVFCNDLYEIPASELA